MIRAEKKLRIGINGFGRIGRLFFRIARARREELEVVWVNDLTDDPTMEYLLRYDTVFGRFEGEVEPGARGEFFVDGQRVRVSSEKDPAAIKWGDLGVDLVLESTGAFRSREKAARHLLGGARKVILSAPAKGAVDATVVIGVNHDVLRPEHKVVSNASCTTNALAPVAKVLDETFGIRRGFMTTVHAFTNDQRLLDLPHDALRRARAAANNIVPTTTGAATAVGEVLPRLKGKLDGISMRVPVPDGSIVDLTCDLARGAQVRDVNDALSGAANGALRGILDFTRDEIVSSDVIGEPASSIVDGASTMVMEGDMVKVVAWYDNEWGYANRCADLAALLGNVG
ncbi:MAG TPA: type I glyceraldehyde-3-phosphate dehydrogenase [Planctomycetota bacterium]|nr:type I glyceraldehyde-3-phosphate dehydrogenase [Planctomycetota bacterium]